MIELARIYVEKAEENLAAAQSEYTQGRYNSSASRAYYACFPAAIHALMWAGIQPPGRSPAWGHDFVQAQFNGQLIARRKMYPSAMRDVLRQSSELRVKADYGSEHVGEVRAARVLRRSSEFVDAVSHQGDRVT